MIFLENMVEIRGEHGLPQEGGNAQLGISWRILLCKMKKLRVGQVLLAGGSAHCQEMKV